MKKLGIFLLLFCLFVGYAPTVSAGSFSLLASTGVLRLSENEAWEKAYKTDKGKFKIRFRKLWMASDQKKYHLIIWWNDKRIADGYCPASATGYGFKIFRDEGTDRIFVSLETTPRAVLMGDDPAAGKLEKYVDSRDYHSPLPYPQMWIDADHDLMLAFTGDGRETPTRYKLFWDKEKKWFGFRDITVRRPEETEILYEEEAPLWEEEASAAAEPAGTGELYYEEEIVTGS